MHGTISCYAMVYRVLSPPLIMVKSQAEGEAIWHTAQHMSKAGIRAL